MENNVEDANNVASANEENNKPVQSENKEKKSSAQSLLKSHKNHLIIGVVLLIVILLIVFFALRHQSSEDRWTKAVEFYEAADYEAAAVELEGASVPNGDAERLNIYAQTMLATKQLDRALEGYEALYNENQDPFTKLAIGNIHNEQGNKETAIGTYEELISTNPAYTQTYVNLASLHLLAGDNAKALETAKKGQTSNPGSTVLAELLVSTTLNDTESAEHKDAVRILTELDPNNSLINSVSSQAAPEEGIPPEDASVPGDQ